MDYSHKYRIPVADLTIIQNLEKEFSCPICSKILYNTVLTGCGVRICRYCHISWMKNHQKCSACRKECQNYLAYPKIDAQIATAFETLGPKSQDERKSFIRRRKSLELKFYIEGQLDEAIVVPSDTKVKEINQLSKQYNQAGMHLGTRDDKMIKKIFTDKTSSRKTCQRRVRRYKNGNVKPDPFKKRLTRNSTGSLRGDLLLRKAFMAQSGTKHVPTVIGNEKLSLSHSALAIGSGTLLSDSSSKVNVKESVTVPNLTTGFSAANEFLSEEFNEYYQRYILSSKKFERKLGDGEGDKPEEVKEFRMKKTWVMPADRISAKAEKDTKINPNLSTDSNQSDSHIQSNSDFTPPVHHALEFLDYPKKIFSEEEEEESYDDEPFEEIELLDILDQLEEYILESALEILKSDIPGESFIPKESAESKELLRLMMSVSQLKCFLMKKSKEKCYEVRKHEEKETQTRFGYINFKEWSY